MEWKVEIESFNGGLIAQKDCEAIIRDIYKNFISLTKKIRKLEKINGISLDRLARVTEPTIDFLRNDGWEFSLGVDAYHEENLWFCAFRSDEKGRMLDDTRKYLTKNGDWRFLPKSGVLPNDVLIIPLIISKKTKSKV